MIQIDMDMPKTCVKCPILDYDYKICPLIPHVPAMQKTVSQALDTDNRSEHCPLQEIPEKEHFKFKIPKKCKDCKSMFSDGPNFYCHMEVVSPENSESDISTVYVDPESRPEWCSIVKMNKMFETMPPERREEFDKIATGLSALFGSVQVSKEE